MCPPASTSITVPKYLLTFYSSPSQRNSAHNHNSTEPLPNHDALARISSYPRPRPLSLPSRFPLRASRAAGSPVPASAAQTQPLAPSSPAGRPRHGLRRPLRGRDGASGVVDRRCRPRRCRQPRRCVPRAGIFHSSRPRTLRVDVSVYFHSF